LHSSNITGISGRACAVIRERGVNTGPTMLADDVTTVVIVDVTRCSAEARMTETHWTCIV